MAAMAIDELDRIGPTVAPAKAATRLSGLGLRAGYGLGALTYGIGQTVLAGTVMQLYFNQVIGLPAAWVGAAIMVTIIIDSITDPMIGAYSDSLRTRWGRRHLLMYASAAPSALGLLVMWHAPAGLSEAGLLAFMVGMLLFVRIATSFYDIPARALAPELAPDYHERTALLAWRFVFLIAGATLVNSLLFQVFLREDASNPTGVLNRDRYEAFGVFAAALIFVVIIVSALATHSRIPHLHVPPAERRSAGALLGDLKAALLQPQLLKLQLATFLNGFGGGIHFGLLAYIYLNFWGLKSQEMGYVLIAGPLGMFLTLWLGPRLSARLGKRPFMMACYVGWFVCYTTPFAARALGLMPASGTNLVWQVLAGVEVFAATFAYGTHLVLQSILTDAADDVSVKTGHRSEGVLFAAFGLLDKWGAAVGAFAAGLILAFVKFPTGAASATVAPEIINSLTLIAIPTIAVCNMVAMLLIWQFRLDQAQHEANLEELRRRHLAGA
jgi:Na+/melibiose symporter-like transporter